MTTTADFEKAQVEAMEMLLQQCVAGTPGQPFQRGDTRRNAEQNASIMDFLAQVCAEANDAVQDMSYEDVATSLGSAVVATQESLRGVRENVTAILDDPEKLRELSQHIQETDMLMLEAVASSTSSSLLIDGKQNESALMTTRAASTEMILSMDEDNVRNMMMFAENMCSVMDNALSTITKDELDLAAQLSLSIAQKLLEAGQALFVSLGEDERRKIRGDRGDHITIEELSSDEENNRQSQTNKRKYTRSKQMKHTATLHNYIEKLHAQTREQVGEHPYLAGALTAASLPFIGLAIPVASLVGVALMVEKYYPEHASVTMDMCSNFVQMMKLSFLLLKISARQVGLVAKECFCSWYEYASANGFVATGMELASTCCSLGCLCASRMYQTAVCYTQRSLQ